jgi:hypothetical protein
MPNSNVSWKPRTLAFCALVDILILAVSYIVFDSELILFACIFVYLVMYHNNLNVIGENELLRGMKYPWYNVL